MGEASETKTFHFGEEFARAALIRFVPHRTDQDLLRNRTTWAAAWVYPAEVSLPAERARIASFAMGAHFGGATLVVGVITLLFAWSQAGTMFLFAAGNCVSFVVVYRYVVETKGEQAGAIVARFERDAHRGHGTRATLLDTPQAGYVQMADR